MDETPTYFDMVSSRTLDFVGAKSIELLSTGHDKNRFTVTLTISPIGEILPALVLFKGLKKVPVCEIPENVRVIVNDNGTMDTARMIEYNKLIVKPYLNGKKGCLILDSFGAHCTEAVVADLKKINVESMTIPGGFTSYLQPLDVSINKPFKEFMREEWNDWFANSDPEYTKNRNRKKPSY